MNPNPNHRHGLSRSAALERRTGLFVAVAISVIGGAALVLMTRRGIGTSPDSVGYIKAARLLLGEDVGSGDSLTHFAPLYSFLLAAGGLFGLDLMEWARWLNGILLGLNIFLVGSILRRLSRNESWFWIIGMVLAACSMPMLTVHVTALSEPVFLFLGLLGVVLLGSYLESGRTGHLVGASAAVGMALLARYAGAAWIITGGLALLLWAHGSFMHRVRDAFMFGVLSSLPMLAWIVRNALVAGTSTGREFVFHPIDRSQIWQALYTASSWLLIPAAVPGIVRVVIWAIVAVGLLVILVRASTTTLSVPPVIAVLALSIAVYAAFLAVSISFFDANTPLDNRILLPVFFAGLIVSMFLLDRAWPALWKHRTPAYLLAAVIVVFAAVHVVNGVEVAAASYARGWGFSSRTWRESAVLARVRELPGGTLIYSNAPEIVYLHTGRAVESIPKKVLLMNRQPNPDFANELAETGKKLASSCGVVVYFSSLMEQKSMPGEEELRSALALVLRADERDGSILSVRECPRP